ncbi:MAG TPA: TlpA disulfide reductase family protein [Chitinophagaceae bacterium]
MRKIFLAIFSFSLLISCKHETKKEFEVGGVIKNATDKIVYLQETQMGAGERIIADSSVIKNDGSYHLKGKADEESLFSLFTENETFPFAYVINDASQIVVNADTKDQNDYEVKGSPASKSLKDFSISATSKWMQLSKLAVEMDSLRKAGAPDSSVIAINSQGESALQDVQNYVGKFIRSSSDPILCVWALGSYSQVFPMDEYQALLNDVVKKFPNHKGIAAVKEMNDRQLAAKQKSQQPDEPEWVNKQAPELSLPDINGNQVKLSSFKGKYVLVDFWASWCLPCRQENPNVLQAYNKFRSKNFTILGVSLDKQKDDWKQAIQKDKLSWTQVSDLQEWHSVAVSTFNFSGIPFNVLVDPDGKIIAEGLRGDELEKKLEEVLK